MKPLKFLNYKPIYLFFGSHYRVYKSTQHILRTCPHKVTNKTNTTLSKFDKFMDYLQHGHDAFETHDNFNITQKFQSFFCKWDNTWRSLFIFIINGLYSSKMLLVGNNIDIHLVFRLCDNLLSFVSNKLASLHWFKVPLR
jgi:hypothetical protein